MGLEELKPKGFLATIEHRGTRKQEEFDQVLVAVGRRPNTNGIGLEEIGIKTNPQGLIPVSDEGRTSLPPTFSEALSEAAEVSQGGAVHLRPPKK